MRNSLSIMADAPAVGLMLTAVWLGICFEESGKMVHFLAAAFFAGFAVMLRYPVALALFFPVLNWLWIAFRRKTWWGLIFFLPCFAFAALPQLLLPKTVGEGLTQPFQHQHFLQCLAFHSKTPDFCCQSCLLLRSSSVRFGFMLGIISLFRRT
jgi:4-amino-4-deoxy-L-arabinose transferase-like glycosyltransferase